MHNGNFKIYTRDLATAQTALAANASGSVNLYAPYWQKLPTPVVGETRTATTSTSGSAVIHFPSQEIQVQVNEEGNDTAVSGVVVNAVALSNGYFVWTDSPDGKYFPGSSFVPYSSSSSKSEIDTQFLPAAIVIGLAVVGTASAIIEYATDPPGISEVLDDNGMTKKCITGDLNDVLALPVFKAGFGFMRLPRWGKALKIGVQMAFTNKSDAAKEVAKEAFMQAFESQTGIFGKERRIYCWTVGNGNDLPIIDVTHPTTGIASGSFTYSDVDNGWNGLPYTETVTTQLSVTGVRMGQSFTFEETRVTVTTSGQCSFSYTEEFASDAWDLDLWPILSSGELPYANGLWWYTWSPRWTSGQMSGTVTRQHAPCEYDRYGYIILKGYQLVHTEVYRYTIPAGWTLEAFHPHFAVPGCYYPRAWGDFYKRPEGQLSGTSAILCFNE